MHFVVPVAAAAAYRARLSASEAGCKLSYRQNFAAFCSSATFSKIPKNHMGYRKSWALIVHTMVVNLCRTEVRHFVCLSALLRVYCRLFSELRGVHTAYDVVRGRATTYRTWSF